MSGNTTSRVTGSAQASAEQREAMGERAIPCPRCGGRGFVFHHESIYASTRVTCPMCGGGGEKKEK